MQWLQHPVSFSAVCSEAVGGAIISLECRSGKGFVLEMNGTTPGFVLLLRMLLGNCNERKRSISSHSFSSRIFH